MTCFEPITCGHSERYNYCWYCCCWSCSRKTWHSKRCCCWEYWTSICRCRVLALKLNSEPPFCLKGAKGLFWLCNPQGFLERRDVIKFETAHSRSGGLFCLKASERDPGDILFFNLHRNFYIPFFYCNKFFHLPKIRKIRALITDWTVYPQATVDRPRPQRPNTQLPNPQSLYLRTQRTL